MSTGAGMQGDPLLRWREEFPILSECTYLISNSLGAMPRGAQDALQSYANAWSRRGVRAWEHTDEGEGWWNMPVRIGDMVAPLIGAGPGEVTMHTNVTQVMGLVLSCFDFAPPRNRVVFSELEFPSVKYVMQALRSRGADVVVIPSADGIRTDTARLLEAIDERTLLVSVSHVLFRSAFINDVAAITRRAREVGAQVLLDVYHSAGVMPFSVHELGVDFAAGGVLKWLCGGPGGAFLWVRPELRQQLVPRNAGWQAHRRPFGFEPEMDLRDDAWRFLTGTPNVPALYAARPGLEIIAAAGLENIRAKSARQTALLVNAALERGWRVHTPLEPAQRGGTVTISPPGGERVCQRLLDRGFMVDYRPNAGIRVAPHFYNSDEEIEGVIREMQDM